MLFYMGGCKNRFEALFLKMLGRLPVDVLILDPDRSAAFALEDQLLYQMNFTETLHLQRFRRKIPKSGWGRLPIMRSGNWIL